MTSTYQKAKDEIRLSRRGKLEYGRFFASLLYLTKGSAIQLLVSTSYLKPQQPKASVSRKNSSKQGRREASPSSEAATSSRGETGESTATPTPTLPTSASSIQLSTERGPNVVMVGNNADSLEEGQGLKVRLCYFSQNQNQASLDFVIGVYIAQCLCSTK